MLGTLSLLLVLGCGGSSETDDTAAGVDTQIPRSPLCDEPSAAVGDCATHVDCDGDGTCESDLSGADGCGMCGVVCESGWQCVDGNVCAPSVEGLDVATYPRFTAQSHNEDRVVGKLGSGVWMQGLSDQFESFGELSPVDWVTDGGFVLLADGTVGQGFWVDPEECGGQTYNRVMTTGGVTLSDVVQLGGGPFSQLVGQSCARKSDGTVWCGPKAFEQVPGISNAVDIAGGDMGCAVLADGTIECWWGQTSADSPDFNGPGGYGPVKVPCVGDAVSVSADGGDNFCFVRSTGEVACFGELWVGEAASWYDAVPIVGLTEVVDVVARAAIGASYTDACALTKSGDVWCFDKHTAPFQQPLLSNVVDLELGPLVSVGGEGHGSYVSVCGLHPDGNRTCVPWDTEYAPGYAWTQDLVPDWCAADPHGCAPWAGMDTEGSDKATCGWTEAGAMVCWGKGTDGRIGTGGPRTINPVARDGLTLVPLPGDVVDAAMGTWTTCALQSDGAVYCWGTADQSGVLGSGVADGSKQPPALILSDAVDMSVGATTSCAADNQGLVWCWGNNRRGQARGDAFVGSGQGPDAHTPVLVGDFDAIEVAAGSDQMCSLSSTGTVTCWGNRPGENWGVPPADQGLTDIQHIVGRQDVVCAVDSGDNWWCWGTSWGGAMLGPINTFEQHPDPVPMPHLAGALRVWPSSDVLCAALPNGSVTCRGGNSFELPCGFDCEQSGMEDAILVAPGSDPVVAFPDTRGPATFRGGSELDGVVNTCAPYFEPFRYGKPL